MEEHGSTRHRSRETKAPRQILLTPEQAADALGIGRWKLYDLLRRGDVASIRIGSCRRIPATALDEYVAELQRQRDGWAS